MRKEAAPFVKAHLKVVSERMSDTAGEEPPIRTAQRIAHGPTTLTTEAGFVDDDAKLDRSACVDLGAPSPGAGRESPELSPAAASMSDARADETDEMVDNVDARVSRLRRSLLNRGTSRKATGQRFRRRP